MNYTTVIMSAGSGSRTGLKNNKNLYTICGKKVIEYSIDFFLNDVNCNQIILVVSNNEFDKFHLLYSNLIDTIIIGGDSRQESVYKSLNYIQNSVVLFHDGARPYISTDFIRFFVGNIPNHHAISIGSRVKDTIHIVDNFVMDGLVDRSKLVAVQTPQCFNTELIKKVHNKAKEDGYIGTDDLSLVYKYSDIKPYIYITDEPNIKFTTKEDIKMLEVILSENRTK